MVFRTSDEDAWLLGLLVKEPAVSFKKDLAD